MTEHGPLPAILRPLSLPAERVYRWVIGRRNEAFQARRGVVELDRPVISVGNLSVGGTGKTPMVLLLLRMLRARGAWPCVAMRGYAQQRGLSDEASEYRVAFPDLPMVVQANRIEGLLSLFASEQGARADCVVLDDGFQHRQIARQLDIVLIDATRDPFADRLLPAGWMREPVENLQRAHAVVLTHAEVVEPRHLDSLRARLERVVRAGTPILTASHEWASLAISSARTSALETPEWLRSRRPLACCAIGNPGAFLAQARRHTQVTAQVVLRDHDPYGPTTVRRIREMLASRNADTLLVTRKDWTKLSRFEWPVPVAVPNLEFRVDSSPLSSLLDSVMAKAGSDAHSQDPLGA